VIVINSSSKKHASPRLRVRSAVWRYAAVSRRAFPECPLARLKSGCYRYLGQVRCRRHADAYKLRIVLLHSREPAASPPFPSFFPPLASRFLKEAASTGITLTRAILEAACGSPATRLPRFASARAAFRWAGRDARGISSASLSNH